MIRNTAERLRFARLTAFLGSQRLWYLILGVFVFQSAWIALTVRYPMAFDEQFHFGIIKQYAHHLSPVWSSQPSGADQLGALTRDPSYLYQYLMSFPYRLISLVTGSETWQIIFLRAINIAVLASALVVFRRLLAQLGASPAMRSVVLGFFVLTPVVPFLGAQINYDNLVILLSALAFSTYLAFRNSLRGQKEWSWSLLARLLLLCLFASLVKYAFLPLATGLALAIIIDWRLALQQRLTILPNNRAWLAKRSSILYLLLLVVAVGLFSERYVGNTVRYHTPLPECNQVLSVAKCQTYAPWARNYMLAGWQYQPPAAEKRRYPFTWIHKSLGELVFTITSRYNDKGLVDYYATPQLVVTNSLSWVAFIGGLLLCVRYSRQLWRHAKLRVLLGVSLLYVAALFCQNLLDYLHLGFPVAIHGRYLLPLLPLFYFCIAFSLAKLLEATAKPSVYTTPRKAVLAASVMLVFAIEGGGFVTLIMRSHEDWFWPQSRPAQLVNQYAQDALRYTVIDF